MFSNIYGMNGFFFLLCLAESSIPFAVNFMYFSYFLKNMLGSVYFNYNLLIHLSINQLIHSFIQLVFVRYPLYDRYLGKILQMAETFQPSE